MITVTGFYSLDSTPLTVLCETEEEVLAEIEYLKKEGYTVGILGD